MTDLPFVLAGYLTVAGAITAYVVTLRRRRAALRRQQSDIARAIAATPRTPREPVTADGGR